MKSGTQGYIGIFPLEGIPEIRSGDELGSIIASAVRSKVQTLLDGDICIVAQKIVSKAEGRLVCLETVQPSPRAIDWSRTYDKDPRVVQVVLAESKRIVRMERGIIISETHHGFVCANAGVDTSNVESGFVTLLPQNPDESARSLRDGLRKEFDAEVAVIVSDTFGRPWREGLVNVAVGTAGIAPNIDYRGQVDSHGNRLQVTLISVADELASAAELVMGKHSRIPAAVVRGVEYNRRDASNSEMIRRAELDLFR
jgi:coenzyme F420-0:L-glutamate ligase/coenzyme F420-1:gamma-L-glutamate ligase